MPEFAMAARFLYVVLGQDWCEQKITFRDKPDEWMHNRKGDTSIGRIVYGHRVVRLANAFFTLLEQRAKGFDTLRQRLQTRATKPCFVEAEIASLLVYNGFEVEIIGETGVRGDDFDLSAAKDGVVLSVEVTAKQDGPLTVQTIINTLRAKRTQVPAHRPAVLYIQVPPEWMRDTQRAQNIFTQAFCEFFKRSRRFNAFVLVWEEVLPFMGGGFPQMFWWGCYCNNPRHPYPYMQLIEPIARPDGHPGIAHSFFDALKRSEAKLLALGKSA
jgi:hypothetical protein